MVFKIIENKRKSPEKHKETIRVILTNFNKNSNKKLISIILGSDLCDVLQINQEDKIEVYEDSDSAMVFLIKKNNEGTNSRKLFKYGKALRVNFSSAASDFVNLKPYKTHTFDYDLQQDGIKVFPKKQS